MWNVNDSFWVKSTRHGLEFAATAAGTVRENLRCAEHVTPAFSVRDSEAVLTVGVGLARQIGCVARASAMPRAGFSFCCHALSVAWRPWPLERNSLLRHGFVRIAALIRRTAGRSGYTCLGLSLSHGSVLVELEVVLYSNEGEACTVIDTSREPLPVCVALPRFRMRKPEWLRTALAVTDKLCTCRRLVLSDIVQLRSSKVWRFKFLTACSPHTGN